MNHFFLLALATFAFLQNACTKSKSDSAIIPSTLPTEDRIPDNSAEEYPSPQSSEAEARPTADLPKPEIPPEPKPPIPPVVPSDPELPVLDQSKALLGTWVSSCEKSAEDNASYETKKVFIEGSVTEIITKYDKTCTIAQYRMVFVAYYVITESATRNGPVAIDFKDATSSLIAVYHEDGAADLTKRLMCGMADWKVGEYNNLKCNRTYFDIFKTEEGHLFFGLSDNLNNGSTQDRRPTVLNKDKSYQLASTDSAVVEPPPGFDLKECWYLHACMGNTRGGQPTWIRIRIKRSNVPFNECDLPWDQFVECDDEWDRLNRVCLQIFGPYNLPSPPESCVPPPNPSF